ncbi:DNA polymerase III subunit epsilon [Rathayibacter phage NCPPB3778]|nr:DNA polymerase III subunit epsilon [Rathayibacter phage NCPPB3778]
MMLTEKLAGRKRLIAVFDTETTGVDVESDRIITAYVGVLDPDGEVIDGREWLINPGVPIPVAASRIHGVDDERAAGGDDPRDALASIVGELRELSAAGVPIVGHNVSYDLTILVWECARYNLEAYTPTSVIDTLVLDKHVDPYRKGSRRLTTTAQHYKVPLTSAHDASADAVAAGRVAQAIRTQYPYTIGKSLEELHTNQIKWDSEQRLSFQKYMQRDDPTFTAEVGWPIRESASLF